MTSEQMTLNELRVKVAEARGYERVNRFLDDELFRVPKLVHKTRWGNAGKGHTWLCDIPDYPRSLDAMHEAEATLTDAEAVRYRDILSYTPVTQDDKCCDWNLIHATAEQRARAFVAAKASAAGWSREAVDRPRIDR